MLATKTETRLGRIVRLSRRAAIATGRAIGRDGYRTLARRSDRLHKARIAETGEHLLTLHTLGDTLRLLDRSIKTIRAEAARLSRQGATQRASQLKASAWFLDDVRIDLIVRETTEEDEAAWNQKPSIA